MRLLFMGTPEYAVPSLRAIHGAGFDVAAVVTRPPRPSGRGRRLQASPVEQAATELGINVLAPEKPNSKETAQAIRASRPEIILVIAYGAILRKRLLSIPPRGCVNAHGSLLPRHRGASPIAAAIRQGDSQTGVTLISMVRELDAGPMLMQRAIAIEPAETAGSLHDKLAQLSAEQFVEFLNRVQAGETLEGKDQDDSQATYAPLLTKEDGRIDWSLPAGETARHVRAMDPWPGAFTTLPDGTMLKVKSVQGVQAASSDPGRVVTASAREGLVIAAGVESLRIDSLQPSGKKPMTAAAFLQGHELKVGDVLGGATK